MRLSTSRMRLFFIAAVAALCLFATVAKAWEPEDHEIFELQSAIEASEGKGATFYSLLNLTKSATQQEIKTAYRRRSVELHPDKHPNDPKAVKRFERLGLVNKILRNARKDRYDHFLATGFPKWRGTGYFYERFRPGIGAVLVGLLALTVALELLVKRINYARDERKLYELRRAAFYSAWGPRFYQALVPGAPPLAKPPPAERKVKLPLSAGAGLPPSPSKSDVEAGKVDWDQLEKDVRSSALSSFASSAGPAAAAQRSIDLLVTREDDGESIVWVTDEASGEWIELNAESALQKKPSLGNSWPLRLFGQAAAAFAGKPALSGTGDRTSSDAQGASSAVAANGTGATAGKRTGAKPKKGRK